jgi:hypothetical protein
MLSCPRPLLTLALLLPGVSARRRNNIWRYATPTVWTIVFILVCVFIVSAVLLQIALWYPNGCLARLFLSLNMSCVSRPILQRRAALNRRSTDPVEGVALHSPSQIVPAVPASAQPIAVGQAVPAGQIVTPNATAIPIPS